MKKKTRIGALLTTAFAAGALALTFTSNAQAGAHSGGVDPGYVGPGPVLLGPQVPLTGVVDVTVKGDYVAAGVGMRNLGGGTINIALPAGSTIQQAFLYWAIIRQPGPPAANTGTLNGVGITGALVGTSGDPCWPFFGSGNFIDIYVDDVTGIALNGANILTNFPSLLTGNEPPQSAPAAFPLLDGASLAVIFSNPNFDFNTVVIRDGAQTFGGGGVMTSFGSFTAAGPGMPADQIAQTSYIVPDGQARFPNDRASFNAAFVAGPGTGLKPADAFDGADGIAPVFPLDGLWDTLNVDVSSFFPPSVLTAADADVDGSLSNDCLTWAAQVISVKTGLMAVIDIKPFSDPNSINTKSMGLVPVALCTTAGLDALDVDVFAPLSFVPAAATPAHDLTDPVVLAAHQQDVCGSAATDLVMHFRQKDTGLAPGDTEACLDGFLLNGSPFEGCDAVRIVK